MLVSTPRVLTRPVLKRTTATRIPLYTIQRLEVRLHTRTCHRAINNSIEQIPLAVETRLMAIGDQYPHLAHLCRLPVLSHLKHRQLFRYLLKHYRPFMKDIGHPMHPSRRYLHRWRHWWVRTLRAANIPPCHIGDQYDTVKARVDPNLPNCG